MVARLPPTFHGVFKEEFVDVGDSDAVRLLRSQVGHPLDEVVHHLVHVVGEDGHVSGTHDELSEDASHLQPVLPLTVKQSRARQSHLAEVQHHLIYTQTLRAGCFSQVKGDSRRDEAGGTAPPISVLLPGVHVGSLRGHALSPQNLSHQVLICNRDHQLGPEVGLEYFSVLQPVLHLRKMNNS